VRDLVEGRLYGDMPYVRVGHGPPLLMAAGLTAAHTNPSGFERRMTYRMMTPFAGHFTVYGANRRPGLAPGATMSDIAGHYAEAIEHDIGEPVFLVGASTGGSVSLQVAIDHPHLVRRLVLRASACRLAPRGRHAQAELARLTKEGDHRRAWAQLAAMGAPRALRSPARALAWLAGPSMSAEDPSDMLVTIAAEDEFDAEPHLGRVTAPTLVVGGEADPFYSPDLFHRTAAGVQDGRAVVLPRKGHAYASSSSTASQIVLGFLLAGCTADGTRPTSPGSSPN
jgi:pimeloyl-ACP methyl ester carboxylesterase